MPINFATMTPRNFDPMSVPGLSNEARKAVNAAFEAMVNWRMEIANSSDKNIEQVIEKMAAAAKALGWPEQIVGATRTQMQSMAKMQIQTMDHMMDAWEEQIKSPNPASAMLAKLTSVPKFGPAGSWPTAGEMAAINPCSFTCNSRSSGRKPVQKRWGFGARAGDPRHSAAPWC